MTTMSKFNVAMMVKVHEKIGKEQGFILFECPKMPKMSMQEIMKIKLDNLTCQKIKKTSVKGCWEKSIESNETPCTIGEWMERQQQQHLAEEFDLEEFWQNLDNEGEFVYPQDCNCSIFTDADTDFNLQQMPGDLLSRVPKEKKIPGICVPMVYAGGRGTFSSLHLEDLNLFSIFYLRAGASKFWIVVYPADALKLLKVLEATFPEYRQRCGQFFRHKIIIVSEAFLSEHGIRFTRVEQKAGQVIITFPMAWHIVVNGGPNIGEAVNFAAPLWLEHTPLADRCKCPPRKGESRAAWFDLRQLVKIVGEEDKEAYFYNIYPNSSSSSFNVQFAQDFPIISVPSSSSSSNVPPSQISPIISVPSSSSSSNPLQNFDNPPSPLVDLPTSSSSSSNPLQNFDNPPSPFVDPPTSSSSYAYCQPCKRKFPDNDALRRHMKSNAHSPSLIKCPFRPNCLQTFTQKSNLQRHIKNKHS